MVFLSNRWNKIGKLNGLIFIAYTTIVLSMHSFVVFSNVSHSMQYIGRNFFTCLTLSIIICPVIIKKINSIHFSISGEPVQYNHYARFIGITVLIIFFYFLFAFVSYYPGNWGYDSIVQLEQALSNNYVDWHPVFHTLLFFKLPLCLTGGWSGSVVFFQICLMTISLTYAIYTILKYAGKKIASIALAFFIINPNTGIICISPLKDTAFAIGSLFLCAYSLNIYFSNGEWIFKWKNCIIFIFMLVCTTLVRHNAILYTLPLACSIMFFIPRNRSIVIAVCFAVLLLIVKGPLYSKLDVQAPNHRVSETNGISLNIIASVASQNPNALNENTCEFVYKIAPKNVWEECYTYGYFNHVKSHSQSNMDPIEDYTSIDIIKMAFDCLKSSPKEALAGLVATTDPVYTLTNDYNGILEINVTNNELGIKQAKSNILTIVYNAYYKFISIAFSHLFHFIGTMTIILVAVILSKSNLKNWHDWKRLFLIVPLFAYNFGTMLFMTHRNDALRFFQYIFYVVPLYILILCSERIEGNRL